MALGFGLLFFGMKIMSDAMQPLRTYAPFIDMLLKLENPLLGILVGTIFTALIQSSSAFTGIIIVLASQGLVTLELELPGFYLESVSVADRKTSRLSLPDQIKLQMVSLPEVPILARSLAVPGNGEVRLRLLENVTTRFVIDPVEPSKGHLDRNRDPATVPPVFSEFYADLGCFDTQWILIY